MNAGNIIFLVPITVLGTPQVIHKQLWNEWNSLSKGEFILRKWVYLTEPKGKNAVTLQNHTVSKKPFPYLTSVCLPGHLLHSISCSSVSFTQLVAMPVPPVFYWLQLQSLGSLTILSRDSQEEIVGSLGKVPMLDQSTGKCWGYILICPLLIQTVFTKQKNLEW